MVFFKGNENNEKLIGLYPLIKANYILPNKICSTALIEMVDVRAQKTYYYHHNIIINYCCGMFLT